MMKMKNRSHRQNINRLTSRHGHKNRKYKKCLGMTTLIYIEQYLSNIWGSIHERESSNTEVQLKESFAYKKRVISDIFENAKTILKYFLVTMVIIHDLMNQMLFQCPLGHNFLIFTLEKHGFGKDFILWVKISLRDEEPCVINGDTTAKYFSL